jgi:hypothetical protein
MEILRRMKEYGASSGVPRATTREEHGQRQQQRKQVHLRATKTTTGKPDTMEELKYRQQRELQRRQQYRKPEYAAEATIATPTMEKLKHHPGQTRPQQVESVTFEDATNVPSTVEEHKIMQQRQMPQRQQYPKPEFVAQASISTPTMDELKHSPRRELTGTPDTVEELRFRQQREMERRQQTQRLGYDQSTTTPRNAGGAPDTTQEHQYRQQQELRRRQEQYQKPEFVSEATIATPTMDELKHHGQQHQQASQRATFEKAAATTGAPDTAEELRFRQQREIERRTKIQRASLRSYFCTPYWCP